MGAAKIETWIKAGYELLAREGTKGIRVEQLARILDLNKSGFYHYFGTMEVFVKKILEHHVLVAKSIAEEISGCKKIDPDLLLLIAKQRTFFLVDAQLLVKGKSISGNDDELGEADRIVNEELLLLWGKKRKLSKDPAVSLAYIHIIRHFFYARISSENINYKFLHTLAVETKNVLTKVVS